MLATLLAQIVLDMRRGGNDRLAALRLAVEQAQRVAHQAPLAVLADGIFILPVIAHQHLKIGWPAPGTARAVQLKGQAPKPDVAEELPRYGHHIQIHGRVELSDALDVELCMLTVAPRLHPLIAENRPDHP